MSNTKVKSRRHSLPSLSSAKQEDAEGSLGKENAASTGVQPDRKRKLPLDGPEAPELSLELPSSKRPAMSITDVMLGNLQEAVTREQLQMSEEAICCLPGGEQPVGKMEGGKEGRKGGEGGREICV